ncbi:hypothetical protein [Rubricoccus marinus]|uniref:DUF4149 domain-containing protein n=1 Tax=Rubricoccus marinus TaxID=716817 RepID=A0A259TYB4_9BACT|nr:hypothetical protein [Rubricoccus marinus]OZC02607.1 hypothetical protein BSZ36_06240 [Rubricoccus marinus]
MIGTIFAALVCYASGAFAAPAAGWEGLRFAYAGDAPPVARTLVIAAVECFVGFGTAALGVGLAILTPAPDTPTLVAASAVGLGFGIARTLRSARNSVAIEAAAEEAAPDRPDAPEAIGARLRRLALFSATVRGLAAVTVPLVAALLG